MTGKAMEEAGCGGRHEGWLEPKGRSTLPITVDCWSL